MTASSSLAVSPASTRSSTSSSSLGTRSTLCRRLWDVSEDVIMPPVLLTFFLSFLKITTRMRSSENSASSLRSWASHFLANWSFASGPPSRAFKKKYGNAHDRSLSSLARRA